MKLGNANGVQSNDQTKIMKKTSKQTNKHGVTETKKQKKKIKTGEFSELLQSNQTTFLVGWIEFIELFNFSPCHSKHTISSDRHCMCQIKNLAVTKNVQNTKQTNKGNNNNNNNIGVVIVNIDRQYLRF